MAFRFDVSVDDQRQAVSDPVRPTEFTVIAPDGTGGEWISQPNDNVLLSLGSDNSWGTVRFTTTSGNVFCVTIGVQELTGWTDVAANLTYQETAAAVGASYEDTGSLQYGVRIFKPPSVGVRDRTGTGIRSEVGQQTGVGHWPVQITLVDT
ncbi:hypothetical protein EWM64_g8336 [Hericium alpestre]|uniref:Uncharacterized protein n=1 Tax=Hericium alpestre TaxID=135208 RepID=A0A4Y9ZM30_9AGAM|nr:hypothetical protein EWM64_g8336 [Hericium alpestre]